MNVVELVVAKGGNEQFSFFHNVLNSRLLQNISKCVQEEYFTGYYRLETMFQ